MFFSIINILIALHLCCELPRAVQPGRPEIRDSAGVTIIVHRTIRNAPALDLVSAVRTMEFGGFSDDPRREFTSGHRFPGAVPMSGQRMLLTDYSSLKLLDQRGQILRIIGREGTGPGEFTQVHLACVTSGDTIIATDYITRKVQLFNSRGDFVSDFTSSSRVVGCFRDGTLLVASTATVNPNTQMPAARAAILDRVQNLSRVRSNGTTVAALGTFPAKWGAALHYNEVSVVPYGDGFLFGDGNPSEVRQYSRDGKLVRIIRWNDRAAPITEEMRRSEAKAMGFSPEETNSLLRRVTPDSLPAYMRVLADNAGRIWIEDHYRAPAPRGFTVFSADGMLLGRVVLKHPLPEGVRVTLAGDPVRLAGFHADFAILWWNDQEGAAHLSLHRVGAEQRD